MIYRCMRVIDFSFYKMGLKSSLLENVLVLTQVGVVVTVAAVVVIGGEPKARKPRRRKLQNHFVFFFFFGFL